MTYNNTLNSKQLIQQRKFIIEEIAELTNRIKFHDTGHIHTTINTLKARKREIDRLLVNDPDWYDEYLLGI